MLTNNYIIKHFFNAVGSIHMLEWQQQISSITPDIKKFKSHKRNVEKSGIQILLSSSGIAMPESLPSGKPQLSDTFISITHSKKFIAIYQSALFEVGIDMEVIQDKVLKIKSKFLHLNENWCKTVTDYTIVWCCKEVVYKFYNILDLDFSKQIEVVQHKKELYRVQIKLGIKIETIFIRVEKIKDMILAYNISDAHT